MDKKTLVENKIEKGKILIDELKKLIKINDALWVYDNEDGNWRLIITSPFLRKEGPLEFYKMINKIIYNKKDLGDLKFENISVKEPNDDLVKMLRAGHKMSQSFFGNHLYQDTYVYFMNK
jgi:hypothetical protein